VKKHRRLSSHREAAMESNRRSASLGMQPARMLLTAFACLSLLLLLFGTATAAPRFDPLPVTALSEAGTNLPEAQPQVVRARSGGVDFAENARVGGIVIEVFRNAFVADGQSPTRVNIRLFDKHKLPLTGVAYATLEVSGGSVLLPGATTDESGLGRLDLDRLTRGIQIKVENGTAGFTLIAPSEPQDVRVRVTAGEHEANGVVTYVPELREWIAAGLIEGVVSVRRLSQSSVQSARFDDGFEREIRRFSREFNGDRGSVDLRVAAFLKGKIRGDYLLTAAYDSDKETRARLLRDVRPDEFYPIYGDSAVRGFEARSAEKLYVRVDKNKSYLLYGDFRTADGTAAQLTATNAAALRVSDLGQYSRTATGAKWHYDTPSVVANLFATKDTLRQMIEEFRGQGISGPFALANNSALENSERVEVIVRDRNQPSVILRTSLLTRLADYTFEPFSGRILLRQPLPALDANFNPVSLRVTYEFDQGGAEYWLYGVDAQAKLGTSVSVGGSYVEDKNPLVPYRLSSTNVGWSITNKTMLVAEVARSMSVVNTIDGVNAVTRPGLATRSGEVDGGAARLELRHKDEQLEVRAMVGRSDPTFNNAAATLNGGRKEAAARATFKVSDALSVFSQAIRSEDQVNGSERKAGEIGANLKFGNALELGGGFRSVRESGTILGAANTVLSTTGLGGTGGGFFGAGGGAVNPVTGNLVVNPGSSFPVNAASNTGSNLDGQSVFVRARLRLADRANASAEVERGTNDAEKSRWTVGADYLLSERSKLYARYENQRGLASSFALNPAEKSRAFVFGVDTSYMPGGQLFTEYRLRDAIDQASAEARDLQLASGVRNGFSLAEGLRATTSVERLTVVSGSGQAATAISGGLEYTANPLWKAATKLEYRRADDNRLTSDNDGQDSWLSTFTVARKLDRDWTLLLRNYLLWSDAKNLPGAHLQDRVQIGFAYRPVDDNRLDLLSKYEYKIERNPEIAPQINERAHIASLHANYHPARAWWATGRIAAKWQSDPFGGYRAALLGGRLTYDVTEKWDVSVMTSVLQSSGGRSRQWAHGAELGYAIQQNLWLSLGMNWAGFKDPDLSGSDYTSRGAFLRLRFKFDEDVFGRRDQNTNRSLERRETR
jgi:hypothetical protein